MAAIPNEARRPGRRRRMYRRSASLAAAAVLASSGAVALAPPAGATDGSCDYGDVCVFAENGTVLYDSPGDLSGRIVMAGFNGYIRNNGMPWWNADHIQVTVENVYGSTFHTCLHYGQNNATDPTLIWLPPLTNAITELRWRGECEDWEEGWYQYF
jgi:hypothetical protein